MNIITILNKLKSVNMVSSSDEGLALFSDCFSKFGISLLLLNDEMRFNYIVDLLREYSIPLQKENGIYALRIFSVDVHEMESIINSYNQIGEIGFLRRYPEIIAEPKRVHLVLDNIKKYQERNVPYKNDTDYDLEMLHTYKEVNASFQQESVVINDVNENIKKYLKDTSLIEKLENQIANNEEEDFNIALELQKVENKICEEYLFPVDDGWKIIINNKEVNSFQEVKNTINLITKLNLSITYHDAFVLVLLYKTHLSVSEIDEIMRDEKLKEGME